MSRPVPRAPRRPFVPPPTAEEVSSGGIVVDTSTGSARVAVIARINRGGRLEWCLPKGHLEGQETEEEAAVREVAEETGIQGEILTKLGVVDYWFVINGTRVHKTVHHYLMRAVGGRLTIENDPDAEAVDVAWIDLLDLKRHLAFSNERRIADLARDALLEHL